MRAKPKPLRPQAQPSSEPDPAFRLIRTVLRQSAVPTAMAVTFSDKLVGDARCQTPEELPLLILLKKIIQEAALIDNGPLQGRRNVLAVLAEKLSDVPTWVYQENPLLALIHSTRPERRERITFLRRNRANFHGADEPAPAGEDRLAEEFADLTEGLTAHDLNAIRRTSRLESMPITRPKALIDYYKFGQREDPWEHLDAERVRTARDALKARVIGQDHAVEAVVEMLISARVGLNLAEGGKGAKPKGVFFFVGPTGVGKTELAKALTRLVFTDENAFARFDMSEYAMEHAAEKLTGSPPGFIGYDEGGQLTRRVFERPFSVLLFDEIEKAHGKVMDKFLQILEDGRLTDSKGQTADFSQTVIIFTSNIGADGLDRLPAGADGQPDYPAVREHFTERVRNYFMQPKPHGLGRPELLNRFGDNILVFDVLRPDYIRAICRKFLAALANAARDRQRLTIEFPAGGVEAMIEALMRGDPKNLRMGGRQVRTLLEARVLKPLNRHVFEQQVRAGATLSVTPSPDGQTVRIG